MRIRIRMDPHILGNFISKLIRIRVKLDSDPLQSKISEALDAQNAAIQGRNWVKYGKKTFYAVTKLILNLFFGKFKHRYWFFADTPNIASNCRVIWKDLWWWAVVSNIGEDVPVQYRCFN